jgi:hypothetical protein
VTAAAGTTMKTKTGVAENKTATTTAGQALTLASVSHRQVARTDVLEGKVLILQEEKQIRDGITFV